MSDDAAAYSKPGLDRGGRTESGADRRKTRQLLDAWQNSSARGAHVPTTADVIPFPVPSDIHDFCLWGSYTSPDHLGKVSARLTGFGDLVRQRMNNDSSPDSDAQTAMVQLLGKLLSLAQAAALSPRPIDEEGEVRVDGNGMIAYRLMVVPAPARHDSAWIGLVDWTTVTNDNVSA